MTRQSLKMYSGPTKINMKKVYIIKRGDAVYGVFSNLKAAYTCLVSHKKEMEVKYLRSYMTLTRIFKKLDWYTVPSNSGPRWELSKFTLVTKFIP